MALFVDIEKKVGKFHLSCRFEAGFETLAILGASGCGKSMTLKCIAGVETPDSGKIVLDGKTLFDSEKKINLPARKRGTGYLFQNYALFPNMTVEKNIGCAIPKHQKNRDAYIREKIGTFYLQGLEKHYPAQLSGGQQQRVAIARMLASSPRLIMLDEPFSAVDSYLKWQLEQEILKLQENFQGSLLYVSHDRDEVFRLCDRVVVMENGTAQAPIQKNDLFANPRTLSAALLSGCKNVSQAEKTGEYALFAKDWNVTLSTDRPVPDHIKYIGVRAHFLEVREGPGENTVCCSVTRVVEDLFSTIVLTQADGGRSGDDRALLRLELAKQQWISCGSPEKLFLHLPKDKILLLS